MSVSRAEVVQYLNELLHQEPVDDVSVNGLQFPGDDRVTKVAIAADATTTTLAAAAQRGCDFMFVHHGLFWTYRKEGAIDEIMKKKLQLMLDSGLSLFASHIPLDMHPRVGNNAQLVRILELLDASPMGQHGPHCIGLCANLPNPQPFEDFLQRVRERIWDESRGWKFHPGEVHRVGIITGQGQSGLAEAKQQGFDTFITGEMNHYTHPVAEDLGVNIILAGHYKTEVHGPIAVGKDLQERFGLPYEFLDFPTGL